MSQEPEEVSELTENRPKRFIPTNGVKFQPGQSGNPGGRPKKKPITELYEQILNDPESMDMLRDSLLKALKKGNMAMVLQLREMTDRVEGKVTQDVNLTGELTLADRIAKVRADIADSGTGE